MEVTLTKTAAEFCERDSGLTPSQLVSMIERGQYAPLGRDPKNPASKQRLLVCDPEREIFTAVEITDSDPDRWIVITLFRQSILEEWNGRPLPMKARYEAASKVMDLDQLENWKRRDRFRGMILGEAARKERLRFEVYEKSGEILADLGWLPMRFARMSKERLRRCPPFWALIKKNMEYAVLGEWFDALGEVRITGTKGYRTTVWHHECDGAVPDVQWIEA
jgi:hypothetical protein